MAVAAEAAPAKVALVHDEAPDPLEQKTLTRLRAELLAAGFEVTEVARATEDARAAAEAEPPVAGVFATIVIIPRTPEAADVWVADRITGKTVVRHIEGGAGATNDVAAVLAVRAVELLKASLLEATTPPPPEQRAAAPAAPTVPADVAKWMGASSVEDTPKFGLAAGMGVLYAPGGVGPALLPVVGFSYQLTSHFAVALSAAGLAFASDLDAPFGTIAVRQALASLDVVYRLPLSKSPLQPVAMLGAGAYHLDIAGTARPPFQGRSDQLLSAMFDAGVGAMLKVSARVSLVADARLLVVTPKPVILAAGERVGRIGQPPFLGRLLLDVAF